MAEIERVQTALLDDELGLEPIPGGSDDGAPVGAALGGGPDEGEAAQRRADEVAQLRRELIAARLAAANLPEPLVETLRRQVLADEGAPTISMEQVDAAIAAMRRAWAAAQAQTSIRGLGRIQAVRSPLDRVTLACERLLGVAETPAHRDAPRLSGLRELYDLTTGDFERRGLFRAERVTLANATTSTMAQVVANALNKALLQAYEARAPWWQPLAAEEDFPTLNAARWITLGGFSDLDTVSEGAAYTEKTWDDAAESASFVKKGNYLGITLEMIDRDDVAAVRAIPKRLAYAARRTLSAAIAELFTANSGVGPTLADSKALFHADHANLGSSDLDATTWDACIQAMWKQAEFHSSKRLGVRPRYCLVPIELEKAALAIFESDFEPGSDSRDANVRRNSSSVITVPEWTDADDWAAAAEPNDLAGVCVGYRYGRAPEIFVADSDTSGAMFTNDELRVKCRFVFAVGVGDYRALYKANVA